MFVDIYTGEGTMNGGSMARASAAPTASGVGTKSVHVRANENNNDNDNKQLARFFVTLQAKEPRQCHHCDHQQHGRLRVLSHASLRVN